MRNALARPAPPSPMKANRPARLLGCELGISGYLLAVVVSFAKVGWASEESVMRLLAVPT